MTGTQQDIARACLDGAENDSMNFPQIVGTLIEAGFEGYQIDFRRATASYYLPAPPAIDLDSHKVGSTIAAAFSPEKLQAAIREAQREMPGYTYRCFCEKAVAAGCAGYLVSFTGRRVLYYGRTAETHTEHFPQ